MRSNNGKTNEALKLTINMELITKALYVFWGGGFDLVVRVVESVCVVLLRTGRLISTSSK